MRDSILGVSLVGQVFGGIVQEHQGESGEQAQANSPDCAFIVSVVLWQRIIQGRDASVMSAWIRSCVLPSTDSGMMIVKAAPTRMPIPNTDITLSRFPIWPSARPFDRQRAPLPEAADLNINGRPPTIKEAASMQTHWMRSMRRGMVNF